MTQRTQPSADFSQGYDAGKQGVDIDAEYPNQGAEFLDGYCTGASVAKRMSSSAATTPTQPPTSNPRRVRPERLLGNTKSDLVRSHRERAVRQ